MRKETVVEIVDAGEKKKFRIRQMAATESEKFTVKMLMLVGNVGTEDNALNRLSSVPYEKLQELMSALLECCSINVGGIETQLNEGNVDGFISERNTLMQLRIEAFKFNDFFQIAGFGDFGKFLSPDIKRQAR